jgi:hypothetical protein
MRLLCLSAFAALTLTVFTGCATSDQVQIKKSSSSTAPAADAAAFCTSLCDRQATCDQSLDQQTCANACKNQNAAIFPRLRSDVVDNILQCVDEKDCKTVLGGGLVGTCASEAVARVAPSDAAVTFCSAMATVEKKCGTTSSKAQCLDTAKLYSDDAIGEAQNCAGRPCSDVAECVAAVFGSFGGSSTPTSPTKPSTCGTTSSAFGVCSSCAQSSCCSEANACANDSGCLAIVNVCASGSPSSSSCSAALQSYPTSSADLASSFFSCASSSCGGSCYSNQL